MRVSARTEKDVIAAAAATAAATAASEIQGTDDRIETGS